MKETILRDGEIAVVIGGAEVIMNVNTAFMVADKLVERVIKGAVGAAKLAEDTEANTQDDEQYDDYCGGYDDRDRCPDDDDNFDEIYEKYKDKVFVFRYLQPKGAQGTLLNPCDNRCDGITELLRIEDSFADVDESFHLTAGTARRIARTWETAYEISTCDDSKNGKIDADVIYATRSTLGNSVQWSTHPCRSNNMSIMVVPGSVAIEADFLTDEDAVADIDELFD